MEMNCNGLVDEGNDFDKEKSYHVERSGLSCEADDTAKSQCVNKANLTYDNVEDEPEIHLRTWIAAAAMFLLNFVQIIALQGPPVVLDNIGASLHDIPAQTWVPNALCLVQAVLVPILSTASDTFQSRKLILVLFVEALATQNTAALAYIPGITPKIIAAGIGALKQAFADTLRVIFIIAAPFGALACILCFFLEDPSDGMTYQVDAPIEVLHVRHRHSVEK